VASDLYVIKYALAMSFRYLSMQALACLARCTGSSQLAVELLAEYITPLEDSVAVRSSSFTGSHSAINTATTSSHQLAVVQICASLITSTLPSSSQQQIAKLSSILIQMSNTANRQVSSLTIVMYRFGYSISVLQ
jgi:hypothetical protein